MQHDISSGNATRSPSTRRWRAVAAVLTAATATLAAGAGAASAEIVAPPSVVPIGGATGTTISDVKIDGVTTTVATVAPGQSFTLSAKLTLGSGVNDGWYYTAPIAWAGFAYPSGLGCLQGGGIGYTQTATFGFVAPSTAGVYHLAAELGPNFTCADSWHPATPGPTVATIVVTGFEPLCDLVAELSNDPEVTYGLCDKLAAAERALDRGRTNAAANIIEAFVNQVEAQSDKAFGMEDAELLIDLARALMP